MPLGCNNDYIIWCEFFDIAIYFSFKMISSNVKCQHMETEYIWGFSDPDVHSFIDLVNIYILSVY